MNYFRITGYYPKENISFIIDCNGMFEKLWQFSSFLVQKGIKVVEVSPLEKILDVNISPAEQNADQLILRATANGEPIYITQTINGTNYKAIKIGTKIYVPNKENI